MLKFGQKEVTTKDFYGKRQITGIFTIDVNRMVISENMQPCNNGKDCRYGVSQYNKTSTYTIPFNVSEEKE